MVIKTDPLDRLILSTSEKYEQKKSKNKNERFQWKLSDLIAKRTLNTEMFSREL